MALIPGSGKSKEDKQAERRAAEDDVLLREIDDAVRQDQYSDFAKTYGTPLLVLLVGGLLAFGGYLFWESRQEAAMEAQSEQLVAALDQAQAGNLDSADKAATALIAESDGGAGVSAKLLRAGVAMERGDADSAAELYGEVADDENAPPILRDIAAIRGMTATFDSRDPQEVIDALQPLAVPGEPFFGSAAELVAMAYLEQDKRAEAGALFGEIAKSEDVPESLRGRSRQMAGLLGVDAIEDVDELLEDQGVPTAGAEANANP
ncbi:MAG: tetratricopeptide repeat protein [Erythrobacter sp.]